MRCDEQLHWDIYEALKGEIVDDVSIYIYTHIHKYYNIRCMEHPWGNSIFEFLFIPESSVVSMNIVRDSQRAVS